ncbi:MAG TPA: FecR family protein [Polyangiaceae bacterium]|nr:FecR family protein [Polyangiaceae bacterium]
MKSLRYARLIAEVFKRGEPRPSDVLSAHSNRDEEIALIERAMDQKRRQSRRLRMAARWSLAGALVLAGAGVWRAVGDRTSKGHPLGPSEASRETTTDPPIAIAIASGGGAIVAAPGSSSAAVAGRALQAGSRLIVDPSAGATLSLSTGTHLEVEPGSQLSVIEDSRAQIFALNAGSLRADVAKLGHDERFIVRTIDTEVEVRGTSFLVNIVASDPGCGAGTTTRVAVYEGVVAVRAGGQEEFLARGEHWPRGCRQTPALPPSAHAAAKRTPKLGGPSTARAAPVATPVPGAAELQAADPPPPGHARRPASSSLAEENDLFAEGMAARRYGNLSLALDKMDRLLEKFPASHLAENATVERMRIQRALEPRKAAAAARQYLQRYPAGFARGDAEAILAGTR